MPPITLSSDHDGHEPLNPFSTKEPETQQHQSQRSRDSKSYERRKQSHSSHSSLSSHRRRVRRSARVKPDIIDKLDDIDGGLYHHEGPYDAASRERNKTLKHKPIDALKVSNEEALKATPPEKIVDCLTKRRPLDGVAQYPPGTVDESGRKYDYEEGHNMMIEDKGNFRRWPGVKFKDEDFKSDPYYQRLQKDLEAQSANRRSWRLKKRRAP